MTDKKKQDRNHLLNDDSSTELSRLFDEKRSSNTQSKMQNKDLSFNNFDSFQTQKKDNSFSSNLFSDRQNTSNLEKNEFSANSERDSRFSSNNSDTNNELEDNLEELLGFKKQKKNQDSFSKTQQFSYSNLEKQSETPSSFLNQPKIYYDNDGLLKESSIADFSKSVSSKANIPFETTRKEPPFNLENSLNQTSKFLEKNQTFSENKSATGSKESINDITKAMYEKLENSDKIKEQVNKSIPPIVDTYQFETSHVQKENFYPTSSTKEKKEVQSEEKHILEKKSKDLSLFLEKPSNKTPEESSFTPRDDNLTLQNQEKEDPEFVNFSASNLPPLSKKFIEKNRALDFDDFDNWEENSQFSEESSQFLNELNVLEEKSFLKDDKPNKQKIIFITLFAFFAAIVAIYFYTNHDHKNQIPSVIKAENDPYKVAATNKNYDTLNLPGTSTYDELSGRNEDILLQKDLIEKSELEKPFLDNFGSPLEKKNQEKLPLEDEFLKKENMNSQNQETTDNAHIISNNFSKKEEKLLPKNIIKDEKPFEEEIHNSTKKESVASSKTRKTSSKKKIQKTAVSSKKSYYVQMASHPTRDLANKSLSFFQKKYSSLIGSLPIIIQEANIPGKGLFYRVRLKMSSKNEARKLCERLKYSGTNCFIAYQ